MTISKTGVLHILDIANGDHNLKPSTRRFIVLILAEAMTILTALTPLRNSRGPLQPDIFGFDPLQV